MYTFFLFCCVNLVILFLSFGKKLIVLLMLESLFLLCVFMLFCLCGGLMYNLFFLFLCSVFMVLDSVLGISLLISSNRNYSKLNLVFNSF